MFTENEEVLHAEKCKIIEQSTKSTIKEENTLPITPKRYIFF